MQRGAWILLGACGWLAAAEPAPAGRLFLVEQDHVQPPLLADYERSQKRLIQLLEEHAQDAAPIAFTTVASEDLTYRRLTPIEDVAALEQVDQAWRALEARVGPRKWNTVESRGSMALAESSRTLWRHRPELSYVPATPGAGFVHDTLYHGLPGRSRDLENRLAERVALYAGHAAPQGFDVYEVLLGSGLPLYVVSETAASPGDYFAARRELQGKLGPAGGQLESALLGLTRERIVHQGTPRPDLSYAPGPRAQGAQGVAPP